MKKFKFFKSLSALTLVLSITVALFCNFTVSAATAMKLTQDFTKLKEGNVTPSDIGAVECDQLRFGCDGQPILCALNGYSEAYGVWKLDAKAGEKFNSFYIVFTGRTWYQAADQKANNSMKVSVSTDGVNYTLIKDYKSNDNTDMNQRYTLDASSQTAGASTVYVKFSFLVFDSPHIMGLRSLQLVGNDKVEVEKEPEKIVTKKSPSELTMVTKFHNFNNLEQGEVTAEDIGAVNETNMYYGVDGVMLLSSRGGYEIASATWAIEAAAGEPINDLIFTFVGHTFYQDPAQKDNNYIKILVSVDNKSFNLAETYHSNDNVDDTQKFVTDLSKYVSGYGKAYVQMQFLTFDSPHIMGIRSVNLTANTAGINTASAEKKKMTVSNSVSFTSLPVGEVSATDIGAEKSGNLYFGLNNSPLLTAKTAGEDAYGIWKIEANDTETFDDCHLTLIGRTGFVNKDKIDTSLIKVFVSKDGENYTEIATLKPTEDESDKQKFVYDLTDYVYGCKEAYVKLYWASEDEPYLMGFRSLSLVGNAGENFDNYTPEIEDVDLSAVNTPEEQETEESANTEENTEKKNSGVVKIVLIVIAAVVVLGGSGFCVWFFGIKKNKISIPFLKKKNTEKGETDK